MTFIFSHCTGLALIARRARAAVAADVVLACPVVEAGLGDARRATPILSPELILWRQKVRMLPQVLVYSVYHGWTPDENVWILLTHLDNVEFFVCGF